MDCRSDGDFEVFLNFRGPDTYLTVVDVLFNTLTHAGFRVFLDNEEFRKGEAIEGKLLGALTNSKVYVVVFSENYTSSKWCLRELTKITECRRSSSDKKVLLPIFCDVNPSRDLKLISKSWAISLKKHKEELGEAVVKPWEDALNEAVKITGWNLRDYGLARIVDLVKEEVFTILEADLVAPSDLVGIGEQLKAIMQLLDEGFPGVRFIVIHGTGGIGKTTLVKYIFKKISSHFQGSCILLVRAHDIVKLQERLLCDTLHLNSIKVSNSDHGTDIISRRLCSQKVLVILDDVDKWDLLEKLAAKSSWFGPGSRIIITTRDIGLFRTIDSKDFYFYEMKAMDYRNALQLFYRHAFKGAFPPIEYNDISTKITIAVGGLPLALTILGSHLHGKNITVWEEALEILTRAAPHYDVQKVFMISYEALTYEQQQIFLDIACFFNYEKKIDPIYFWEACKLYPKREIIILVDRSLIVNDDDKLWMHDLLMDLGRAIAQPKSPIIPTKLSRLWSSDFALYVVREEKVVENIVALELGTLDESCSFAREELVKFVNLKFIQMKGGNFEGNFENIFQHLRWLSWFNCPSEIKAANLSFQNLVVLKLSGSQITEYWDGWAPIMVAKHLKVLNLSGCTHLTKTPAFFTLPRLERLILKRCKGLEEIDRSIIELRHLNYLKISNGSWKSFGGYLQEMPRRPQLLPEPFGGLASLTVLKINSPALIELPPSIGELAKLRCLHLRCPQLRNLPDSIGKLILLNELDLWGTKIAALPETIGNLTSLKIIDLRFTWMIKLPKALGKVENLEELHASECAHMDGELPEEIGKLSRLGILNLYNTKVSRVPTTINQLSNLRKLVLGEFYEPQVLPELPTSLTSLEVAFSSFVSHRLPNLSNMTNLVTLKLFGGTSNGKSFGISQLRVQTPKMEWLASLVKMEELILVLSDLILLPIDLSSLSRLRILDITCFDPQSLTGLPSNLERLTLHDVESPSKWQLFSNLNNLSTLKLYRCWYREFQVDSLGQLKNIHLHTLMLEDCQSAKGISGLSCLEGLRKLEIVNCPHLVDVQGLGEVESLQSLWMIRCSSIQRLPDLSSLKELQDLIFLHCESLESIPSVNEETTCNLEVSSCEHFDDFRGPYKKQKSKKRKINYA